MSQPDLAPNSAADSLGTALVDAEDVQDLILYETLSTESPIYESGRTACGSVDSLLDPLERFPTAVDLPMCTSGGTSGIIHTHVTQDQLREPIHSLPDFANVVFGAADASLVVGAERSHLLVAADNRQAMADAYRNAVGVDVDSPADVVAAIENGRLRDLADARARVAETLDSLIETPETPHPRFTATIDRAPRAFAPDQPLCVCSCDEHAGDMAFHAERSEAEQPTMDASQHAVLGGHGGQQTGRVTRSSSRIRSQARAVAGDEPFSDRVDLAEVIIATAVGQLTSRFVERTLFGE